MIFDELTKINKKPDLFSYFTTDMLWTDPYICQKLLELHLKEDIDIASRNKNFIKRSAEWIISHFNIDNKSAICDLGCGPGLYTTLFAKTDADVTGVDFSKNSLNYAKSCADKLKLKINYIQNDYLKFNTDKKFDLITLIYCDFCALNPDQRKTLLNNMFNYLKDDGRILLDVFSLSFFKSMKEQYSYEYIESNGFWAKDSYFIFKNSIKYYDENVFLDKYNIYEKHRIREIYNWLQCYNIDAIKKELKENSFIVDSFYSNVAGDEYNPDEQEIAVSAKKWLV